MYRNPIEMEPMLPTTDRNHQLDDLCIKLLQKSGELSSKLHPITRNSVAEILRVMNSYYSNLIEGHSTHPADINKALKKDYSKDPAKRALQEESAAHVEVQKLMEARLEAEPKMEICSKDFICWIHQEFYRRLSSDFQNVTGPNGQIIKIIPGKIRSDEVEVGEHIPPAASTVESFLARFKEVFSIHSLPALSKYVAAAASHHRLAWIHPFLDGNGRVIRLFSHAYIIRLGLQSHGLWAISRGLARRKGDYMAALTLGDSPRRGDLDGRGNLSDEGLVRFCKFYLETCIDQVEFMSHLLDLDGFLNRVSAYATRLIELGELKPESIYLLREALLRGEIDRGEASHLTGVPERSARIILGSLIEKEMLTSDSAKKPVRLGFPDHAIGYYFPRLYPEGVF